MNNKLWKTIEHSCLGLMGVILIVTLLAADFNSIPDGGWNVIFPSKAYRITGGIIVVVCGLLWVFATQVRKEGEVSFRAAQQAISLTIIFGLFFIFLQYLH